MSAAPEPLAVRPDDHPLRYGLNAELHARAPESLEAPLRVSYLMMIADGDAPEPGGPPASLGDLCARLGGQVPAEVGNHVTLEFGSLRVRWERHTEFSRYTFFVPGVVPQPFAEPAITAVPAEWVRDLPGQVLVAAHLELRPRTEAARDADALADVFDGNMVVGAEVGDGACAAYTDFQIHADGYSRFLVEDRQLTPRQAGRTVQRLLEIESYVMLALTSHPMARALMPDLSRAEGELAAITDVMAAADSEREPLLLDQLSALAARIERTVSATQYRLGAALAYYALVERRVAELRERRLEGLQTLQEFTERRMAPAMSTCSTVARLQENLSQRVARAGELLRTRVDIALERQNQSILHAMARRARLQLRLQETVEGLSVAAITYYLAGLVGYLAKGGKAAGIPLNPDLAVGCAIPLSALLVAFSLRRMRRRIARESAAD